MFTKKVTDDEAFMRLSSSAQALYLHLSMCADDDGFTSQISVPMFKAHASVQDLEALLVNRFIYQFDNGVIVIAHWRMANALRKDRYTPTMFQNEIKKLVLDDSGVYDLATTRQPTGNQVATQDKLSQVNISANNTIASRFAPPTPSDVENYATEKGLTIDADKFCDFYESKGWMVGKNKMKDWKAAVRGWCSRNKTDGSAPQVQRNAKVQASQGFGTERKDVDYNTLVMERIKRQWAEEEDT